MLLSICSIVFALLCVLANSILYCVFICIDNIDEAENMKYQRVFFDLEKLKVTFIFTSFILDIYKWCLFIIASKEYQLSGSHSFRKNWQILNITLTLIVIYNFISAGTFIFLNHTEKAPD